MSDLVSNMKKAANAARKAAVLLEASSMVFRTDQPNVQRVMGSKSSMGLALSNLYSKGGEKGTIPESEFAPNVERVIRSRSSVGRGLTDIYSKNNERQAAIEADKKQQKIELAATQKSQKSLEKIEKSQVDMLKVTRTHTKKVEKFQEEHESIWKKLSTKLTESQKDKRLGSPSGGWTVGLALMRIALGGKKDEAAGAMFNSLPDNIKAPLEGVQNSLREKMGEDKFEALKGGLTGATALSAIGLDPAKISAMLVGFFQDSSFLGKILGGLGLAAGGATLLAILQSKDPLGDIKAIFTTSIDAIVDASKAIVDMARITKDFLSAILNSDLAKFFGLSTAKADTKKEGGTTPSAPGRRNADGEGPQVIAAPNNAEILERVMSDRSGSEYANSEGGYTPSGSEVGAGERLNPVSGAIMGGVLGGTVGSVVPFVGTGVGTVLGAAGGAYMGYKDSKNPSMSQRLGDKSVFGAPTTGKSKSEIERAMDDYYIAERLKILDKSLQPSKPISTPKSRYDAEQLKRMEEQSKNKSSSNVTILGGPQTTVVQGGGNQGSGSGSYLGSTTPSGTAHRPVDDMLALNSQMTFFP